MGLAVTMSGQKQVLTGSFFRSIGYSSNLCNPVGPCTRGKTSDSVESCDEVSELGASKGDTSSEFKGLPGLRRDICPSSRFLKLPGTRASASVVCPIRQLVRSCQASPSQGLSGCSRLLAAEYPIH